METDKYKLAFQKIFDKKKLKDKYRGNPQDAAKKALEKVKRMKGAADFNMFINNYKGDIKGIKVFLKKNKKKQVEAQPQPQEVQEPEVLTTPAATPKTPKTPKRSVIKVKARPTNNEEEMSNDSLLPDLDYLMRLCRYLSRKHEEDTEEEDTEEEEESSATENEQSTPVEDKQVLKTPKVPKTPRAPKIPKTPRAPKIPKTPKPTMEETEPLHSTQGPTPMMTPKQTFPEEPLEAPPAPKASSKAAPSFSTPTATPKIKNVKQVAPKPPRKIPQGLTQKYETSTVTFDLSATSPASPTAKRIKDYRNNPEDRRAAYTKMCRCM